MKSDFNLEMQLDGAGVVLYRFSGVFDVERWAEQHVDANARIFGKHLDPDLSRPAVTDVRQMEAPPANWLDRVHDVFGYMDVLGERQGRSALITGGDTDVEIACQFFIKLKDTARDGAREIRLFENYDEGYAWATEGWQPMDRSTAD